MDRRDFLKSAGIAAAGGVFAGAAIPTQPSLAQTTARVPGPQPNILFILVDELRFPSVFPAGVTSVDQFLARFMPNVHSLWQSGVKFGSHYTAASACSPSRGVLISGLYSQQSWLLQTIKNGLGLAHASPTPLLNPAYPTYGKLLRRAGYQTPYIGKWHASLPVQNPTVRLQPYGFQGLTYPDPDGANLQATVGDESAGYLNDQYITNQAVQYLGARQTSDQPWCLTVGLVNPHDQQFFWAGTEFQTYNNMFPPSSTLQPLLSYSTAKNGPVVSWDDDPLKAPPPLGYPTLPPNWESGATLQANKPSSQYFARTFSNAVWGGITDDPSQSSFSVEQYPGEAPDVGIGIAPYSYWQRNLDSYTNVMAIVDQRIGEILNALPADVAQNTVIIFGSDHGDYNGAHGFVAGKVGSVYEEPFHVPLIVVDPSGRFTGDIGTVRTELTSSVDMMAFLVSLGHNGSRGWMTGDLAEIYGTRHDMVPMLQSASAAGRPYVMLATDELVPGFYNFNDSPLHIVGLRTPTAKLGTYSKWNPLTGQIVPGSTLTEFYDYNTPQGAAELLSTPNDPRAEPMLNALLNDFIPNELRAPLPGAYGVAQKLSREIYLAFQALIKNYPPDGFSGQTLRDLLGFGAEF